MSEEHKQVLEMIASGVISAEEGEQLLRAMQPSDEPSSHSQTDPSASLLTPFGQGLRRTGFGNEADKEIEVLESPPDKPDWAKFWAIPTAAGAFLAALGLGYTILAFSGNIGWGWLFLTFPLLSLGILLFLAGWFSKNSKWLHIRVKDGSDRVNINLPLPLGWIGWGVKIARPFAPQLADFATDELLEVLTESSPEGVFWIDVEESESEHVQIYYG